MLEENMEDFSSYSESSIRPFLPDDLSTMIDVCSIEFLCYQALVYSGDPTCEFIPQDAGVIQEQLRYYELDPEGFTIEKDTETGKWLWSIRVMDPFQDGRYDINLSGARDDDGMRSLRHDIVGMALSGEETDIKLKTVFPELWGTEQGNLSPDYYRRLSNSNYFIEIGTTKADDPIVGQNDLKKKFFKYGQVLETVGHESPCHLIVVIIGGDFVVSNHPLHPRMVEKLTLYMNLALALEMRIQGLNLPNLMFPRDSHVEVLVDRIHHNVDHMELDTTAKGDLDITVDFIKRATKKSDRNKVRRYFLKQMKESVETVSHGLKTAPKQGAMDDRRTKFEHTMRTQESRTVPKAIVGMPLFICPRSEHIDQTVRPFHVAQPDFEMNPTLNLWAAALRGYSNYEIDWLERHSMTSEELYYTNPNDQKFVMDKNKEFRKTAHRCNVKGAMTDQDLKILALDGLWGKKHQNEAEKIQKEKHTKLPYHYDVSTIDVDEFISNSDIYDDYPKSHAYFPSFDLLSHSLRSLGQTDESTQIVNELASSKIFNALQLMSDIAMEITLSLQQYTKPHQVLLKKLPYYDVYLLLLPTKASEHIFFSIFAPGQSGLEVLSGFPFREMRPAMSKSWYTDFCSFRPEKLANIATADSAFIGIVSYFCHHYRSEDISLHDIRSDMNIVNMINFTLLVRLENKLATEEAITVSRYMYMEVFKSISCIKPDPYRLICKFDPCVRSRLQLFVIKRLLIAFEQMIEHPPFKYKPDDREEEDPEEDTPCNDYWRNLLNPYTLRYEESAAKVVSLFYLGYAVDKDQTSQANSDFKTIEKAIKKDREYIEAEADRSNGSWDNFEEPPKEKQFSINAIIYGVELMEMELSKNYGTEFRQTLLIKIYNKLAHTMTHDLATLKASARLDHLKWEKIPTADGALRNRSARYKAVESVMKELDLFEHNPYINLSMVVNAIEITNRGVLCDLFKKNQHGGLREIYVLTIKSRVVALFLEVASRVICGEFECETMTHPHKKLEVIERHKVIASTYAHKKSMYMTEYQCSADKKSWNHNLVMPALAIPLLRLLPVTMHPAIQRILNMWNGRELQLPLGVLRLLDQDVPLSSPTYVLMTKEFNCPGSTGGQPLFPSAKSSRCKLYTGMMQGILHYTSSLLHVAYLHLTKALIKSYLKITLPSATSMIDQMCSSDDSATILTIFVDEDADDSVKKGAIVVGEAVCETLKTFCQYSCFTNSEKSVMGSSNHLEFNSEFIIGNTVAVPIIKWLFACFNATESEDLLMRSQTFYNLLGQLNSSGLPALNTMVVQNAQGILHYKLLGSSTNSFFSDYSLMIKRYPDPSLGYFILDNIFAPGILGFSYQHWFHSQHFDLFRVRKKSVLDGTLGFNPEGGIVDTFKIRHGESSRYQQLVKNVSGGDVHDLREKVNSKPLVLYSDVTSKEDAAIRISAKCLLPGTAQALKRGIPFIQAVATSVYALQTYAFTKTETFFKETEQNKQVSKISLMAELRKRTSRSSDLDLIVGTKAESLCFPNYKRYREYTLALLKYRGARKVSVRPMRCRKTTLRFSLSTSPIPISLYDLVREKWAGRSLHQSYQLRTRSWHGYRELFPWLSDTLEETLEKSPFMDHVELHNFVSSDTKPVRKVIRIGPAIRATNPMAQLEQIARRTFQDGYVLRIASEKVSDNYRMFRDRRTSIGLALEIPMSKPRELHVEIAVNQNPIQPGELELLKERSRREAHLAIIVAKLGGTPDNEIKKAIDDLGDGLFISWTQAQKKSVKKSFGYDTIIKWEGKGEIVLSNDKFVCVVETMDTKATKIKTNNAYSLMTLQKQVLRLLKEQNLSPADTIEYPACRRFLTEKGLSAHGPGTPVIEMPDSPSVKPPENINIEFGVVISHGKLTLVQRGLAVHSASILIYRSLLHEYSGAQDSGISRNVWSAWYNQSRLDSEVGLDTIRCAIEKQAETKNMIKTSSDKIEAESTTKFLKDTLLSRLRFKGYSTGVYAIKETTTQIEEAYCLTDPQEVEAMLAMLEMEDLALIGDGGESLLSTAELPPEIDLVERATLIMQETPSNLDQLSMLMNDPLLTDVFESHRLKEPPLEFVSSQLSSQYGVMQFWDPLINGVAEINPNAWRQLIAGMEVSGVNDSKAIAELLSSKPSKPARRFGRPISDQVATEAVEAIYLKTSRASSRTSMSTIVEVYDSRFQETARRLLNDSKKFRGKEDLIDEFLNVLKKASEETLTSMNEERLSEADSEIEALTHEDQSSCSKVSRWLDSNKREDSDSCEEDAPDDSLLTDEELTPLHDLLVAAMPAEHIKDPLIITSSALRGGDLELKTSHGLMQRYAFFCLLGSSEQGHWVSFVTGMNWEGKVEYYDSLYSDSHLMQALDQLRVVFPQITLHDVEIIKVRRQTTQSCGHTCFMMAAHRLMNWSVAEYDDSKVRRWVKKTLRTRNLKRM